MRINKRASLERVYPHRSFTSGGINSHTIRNIRVYTIDRHSGVVFMLNENSDGTVLCGMECGGLGQAVAEIKAS